jgi:hypothetical protein
VIKGTVNVDGRAFGYGETSAGKSRGIVMSTQGAGSMTYFFSPNPHNDPAYNKNQPTFYAQMANRIGEYYVANRDWPAFGTAVEIKISKVEYTLNNR